MFPMEGEKVMSLRKVYTIFMISWFTLAGAWGESLTIIEGGEHNATIVITSSAPSKVKTAAQELMELCP